MSQVKDLINEIKVNNKQTAASSKDEVRVMRAMLNDIDFKVDEYNKNGKCGEICPAKEARELAKNIIATTTKISSQEAEKLAENYEFKKSDAENMLAISKEFTNTYLSTGRKLTLGGRENSNISLAAKTIPSTTKSYPKKVGVNADGTTKYEKVETTIAEHGSIRVFSSCPSWAK